MMITKTIRRTLAVSIALMLAAPAMASGQEPDRKSLTVKNISPLGTFEEDYGCAAVAFTNLLGFWNDLGCPLFFHPDNGSRQTCDSVSPENVNRMLEVIYENVGSFSVDVPVYGEQDFTMGYNVRRGIQATLDFYGVEGVLKTRRVFTFEDIRKEIDNGRPCVAGMSFNPYSKFFLHYSVITGYVASGDRSQDPNQLIMVDFRGITEQPFYPPGAHMSMSPTFLCTLSLDCGIPEAP